MTQPQQPQPYIAQPYTGTFGPPPPASPPPPAPLTRRNRLILIAVGALVAIGLVVGALTTLLGADDQVLKVRIQLLDIDGASDCDGGGGGYDDIGPGMPVTVRDQDGKLIGSGSLPDDGEPQRVSGQTYGCIWETPIVVTGGADQYAIEGGDRGAVTYPRAELDDRKWTVSMSIGDD